ncbi:MAG: hypothetical protein VXX11_09950 [Planctomycetota bacterium]|nr:hypothetical protein [Planctomycetota bacterium]
MYKAQIYKWRPPKTSEGTWLTDVQNICHVDKTAALFKEASAFNVVSFGGVYGIPQE